ncbi:hypothetical protein CTI12_AA121090 [Artemisia annua]|uniref:Zinc finger, U1-type n=1 Tax=Artemisia annua TaxID=35608 RepID=A0A2U1PQF8_ARTAN|nr:hypothetical protein CTI12_AA121090 [Artemisia annua]
MPSLHSAFRRLWRTKVPLGASCYIEMPYKPYKTDRDLAGLARNNRDLAAHQQASPTSLMLSCSFISLVDELVNKMFGVKRKQSTTPLYAAASSSGVSLDNSKKRIEEWNCAIYEVSATSACGLSDHIAGKKHQAKVAAVAGNRYSGLVKNKTPVMEQPSEVMNLSQCVSFDSKKDKIVGESLPKKFTRRCKLQVV